MGLGTGKTRKTLTFFGKHVQQCLCMYEYIPLIVVRHVAEAFETVECTHFEPNPLGLFF